MSECQQAGQGDASKEMAQKKPLGWFYVVNLLLFAAFFSLGLLADLESKRLLFANLGRPGEYLRFEKPEQESVYWLVEGFFGFQTALNEGAMFGIGQGQVVVLAVLSVVALLSILLFLLFSAARESRFLSSTLGLILAGVVGNLYDRFGWHDLTWNYPPARIGEPVFAVRDWILFRFGSFTWPNFNIADSLLVCGAILLSYYMARSA